MAYVITGNLWRNGDSKEVVAGTWESVEAWLKEKYDSQFSEVSMNTRGLLSSVRKYNGLEFNPKNREIALETITKDVTKSRANFLRGIENFGYSLVDEDFSFDGIPLARTAFIEPLVLYYGKQSDPYNYRFSIQPTSSFFMRPKTFYQGHDIEHSKREDERERKFLDRATDASSLVVSVSGFGPAGLKFLKQFYRQARRKVRGK